MSLTSEQVRWHALLVKPRTEKKVGQKLKEMGIENCVPVQKQLRQWSDRKKLVEVVVFSNYVFVAIDCKRRNEVFAAGSVVKFVQFGGKIATLSAEEVQIVKNIECTEQPIFVMYNHLCMGEEVEVVSGPLAGMRGKVRSVNRSTSKVELSMPSLLCCAHVELCNTQIRRV